ncbi:hypothetical protein SAMN04488128_1021613 [Chitinophaga eiseniae]|uniref:Uncharacterized protein n=1 Tax=Chitinophaga eiseniae TaxID=634771 RepID=A0A1T4RZL4_9BACT|nr:hypothetical protein [Chitinophaga eiseniae]SKA21306.1 hypothetical protein SAMN04488128_1021613 [Chitinophaga eiseniae]
MKGFWSYFWVVYMLFFAIPFPMLIYYNTREGLSDTNPYLAITWLALSVILWTILALRWFHNWILLPFKMKRNMDYLLREGERREARVVESKDGKQLKHYMITKGMTVSLRNFVGTPITEKLELVDTKPGEMRYEKGRVIYLMIDKTLKLRPYLTVDTAQADVKAGRMLVTVLLWLGIVAAIVWYYYFSYNLENDGYGWRFMKFYHPLVLCPVILFATRFGLGALLKLFSGGDPGTLLRIKYYGIQTMAEVVSASQTGTYINEQPQVKFELRYKDEYGKTYNAELKKIVSLIDLGMTRQETVSIFYLKDKPSEVAFADDLDD